MARVKPHSPGDLCVIVDDEGTEFDKITRQYIGWYVVLLSVEPHPPADWRPAAAWWRVTRLPASLRVAQEALRKVPPAPLDHRQECIEEIAEMLRMARVGLL